MKQMTASEIRRMWLDFFKEKGHNIQPSAPLVPIDDPTLLWINSGVATLKKYFDGREIPSNPRIVNAQKSIRTNDIENVGKTARHHTFFEMLGNFSIGDYFRKEAIEWGWELLTSPKWFGFDKEKLYITVYPEDKDTYNIWLNLGVDPSHIILLEYNFWEIGEGPCGPCTEIFYDRGTKYDPENIGVKLIQEDIENDRYIEIWNIVLSQYNSKEGLERSEYPELPSRNIDTGMGLERMACVIQGVDTNFDSDLFMPIIKATESISGRKYGEDLETTTAFKVIADHIRTVAFAIGDGALPSNEGRGYVLRRLLRRAVRYAKKLNIQKPFMSELVPVVGEVMSDYYPEVKEKKEFIQNVINSEEIRFLETLNDGLSILSSVIADEKANGSDTIKGEVVFKLYDTYGFPVELTEEYAEDENMKVDHEGFKAEMEKQRERARSARAEVDSMQVQNEFLMNFKNESQFVGYETYEEITKIIALLVNGTSTTKVSEGEEAQIILEKTPFYAESGGQIADGGFISNNNFNAIITDVQKAPNGQNIHSIKIINGSININDEVTCEIDKAKRNNIIKNHTATHILHQALKDILGAHVNQAGSLVTSDRIRFDFTHFGSVSHDELEKIEEIVNRQIWGSNVVDIKNMTIDEAKSIGAMALFGEKYGDVVRVVKVGDYSTELCGGCHVDNSATIGIFKILSESGIGAGTRRIEAVTGENAYKFMNDQLQLLKVTSIQLKSNIKDVPNKVEQLILENKNLLKDNESLTTKLSNMEVANLINTKMETNGVSFISAKVPYVEMNHLRSMVDDLKKQIKSGIIVLGCVTTNKVNLTVGVTEDLIKSGYHAGNLIKELAAICGGGGGGRPDMAQAGGKNPDGLQDALNYVSEYLNSK
jgi:alanyl-tRNA synthetase